jgi:uncharacterized membrane protein YvbJ
MNCPCCGKKLIENQKIYCLNCGHEYEYEDFPSSQYQEEREIAEKIREELLPKQKVRIRLVKD